MPDSRELEEFLRTLKSNQASYNDNKYYASLETVAQMVRQKYSVENPKMGLRLMRAIYKQEGIRIDTAHKRFKKVRGAYFYDDGDCSVLISPGLPTEPKLFTLAHELKHHLTDQDLLAIPCVEVTGISDRIEIGAEIFAAELILPIADFKLYLEKLDIRQGKCSAENICQLKHDFKMHLSYQSICKRMYLLKIAPWGCFDRIKFQKLSEQIYGIPFYKKRLAKHLS